MPLDLPTSSLRALGLPVPRPAPPPEDDARHLQAFLDALGAVLAEARPDSDRLDRALGWRDAAVADRRARLDSLPAEARAEGRPGIEARLIHRLRRLVAPVVPNPDQRPFGLARPPCAAPAAPASSPGVWGSAGMAGRHGGRVLADQLRALGATRAFSVPGESFLALLDGLLDAGIQNVVCRHEGGAAMMAEAHGKMTGTPGLCLVTRGPGATNAAAGVHVARQDSTPMILFVGDIDRGHRDREAFQEVDFRAMFGPLAKWVASIDATDRIPEYVARAWGVALSGRPGPVVLTLPEDVLSAPCAAPLRPPPPRRAAPDLGPAAAEAMALLAGAESPMVVVGGPHWSQAAADDLGRFASAWRLPVACAFRRQDFLDNRHPCYAGDLNVTSSPALAARLREADAILVLGTRLGDIETGGYALLDPSAERALVHVHPDPDEPGRVWPTTLAVAAEAPAFVAALAALSPAPTWPDRTAEARAGYESWAAPKPTPGAVRQEVVVAWLSENLPDDAILTNGAGNFAAFLHRYFCWKRFGTQLAPGSGSMGYGIPAAVAAAIQHPGRRVVCVAGDGDAQMTLNELSTAAQAGAAPIVVVMNNGRYGTIRMHQERAYPGRVSGTDLRNPDFAALARAYGGHGETVAAQADFPAAFARAQAAGVLAVIECRLDPEALTPGMTLSEVRAQGTSRR